jgi:ABC-type molybdenum transport system ATPase subunit/photorepair protein PhrA
VDGGLDAKHRSAFLTMLDKQMNELNSEQSFIVSHNLQSFVTLPMDVIRLSDVDNPNRLQNIIYDASE